jgi:hypothetical protein
MLMEGVAEGFADDIELAARRIEAEQSAARLSRQSGAGQ